MKTVCELNKCAGCMACVDICPKSAIHIKDSIEAFNAVIDEHTCIKCNACHRICQCNHPADVRKPMIWKQGWAQETIRQVCSSGGFGTAIIRGFIDENSYVAACMHDNGKFDFYITNSSKDSSKFSGSKYVKSNPAGIYTRIVEKLKKGKRVLFIGLPCQVSAARKFVGETLSKNFYCIDLICHGSPSPKLLTESLEEYGYDIEKIHSISFRNKTNFGISIDDKRLLPDKIIDRYTMAFLNGLCYTENCYSCYYAQINRAGDLTIGDSWGTELNNEMDRGVSLVLCQTQKGIELLSEARVVLKEVDIKNAVLNNKQLSAPSKRPKERARFFKIYLKNNSFNKTVKLVYPKECVKQDIKVLLFKMRNKR